MTTQKILLVGDPRICPQVAYVMDWQNFEQVEQLTDAEKFHDYKIVVCAFKKKSKKLVKVKDKTLNIIYLDEICQELDAKEQGMLPINRSVGERVPLWRRIIDRVKEREVQIAFLRRSHRKHGSLKCKFLINKIPIAHLTTSEMLLKVLFSKSTNIACNRLSTYCVVYEDGNLYGCCPPWTPPMGSIEKSSLDDVYHGQRARIIRLSIFNHSYCFCDLRKCEFYRSQKESDLVSTAKVTELPQSLELAIDKTCNLRCATCRSDFCVPDDATQHEVEQIVMQMRQSDWLDQIPNLVMQGAGEVFCSPTLKRLLMTDLNRDQIHILSNGILFNRQNWELLKNKYRQIDVEISVDAATAATYQKIRGGNFQQLMHNLEMLGNLRAKNEIRYFELNFVVQRDNYLEMVDFVRLAKRLHVDRVHFTHLNNWGTFTKREYRKKCLIICHRRLHRDLQRVLVDPIFQDPIVDLLAFSRYISNFAEKFPQSLRPRLLYDWEWPVGDTQTNA